VRLIAARVAETTTFSEKEEAMDRIEVVLDEAMDDAERRS
jgi:hypothetical protein